MSAYLQARVVKTRRGTSHADVAAIALAAAAPVGVMLAREAIPPAAWIVVLAPLVVFTGRRGWTIAAGLLFGTAAICAASVLGYAGDWRQAALETACFLAVAVGAPQLQRLHRDLDLDLMPAPRDVIRVATALPTHDDLPDSLSRRERDVVLLAAQGLRSADIGAQLFISQRTVESHLANAYGKLHLHSRAELIAMVASLGRPQPVPAIVSPSMQHGMWLETGASGAA
jgi:DNA-binding CsgD family transcriptional regulator